MNLDNERRLFDELMAKRGRLYDANEENDTLDGLKGLLTDMYPREAHFIYELIQNAEDAGANKVHFALGENLLTVTHDGRPFTIGDVEAITNIGRSQKTTGIGKFGVGFKAVFNYTECPRIRSGRFDFTIRNLFVPHGHLEQTTDSKTIIQLPFGDEATERFMKTEKGLRDLLASPESILFISNIARIDVTVHGETVGALNREDDEGIVSISTLQETTHWLRLTADTLLGGESRQVAAAFRLVPKKERKAKNNQKWQVEPLDRGRVCVYFPADKESSGLRFHIHAPFDSTIARDSIKDSAQNDELIEAIGRTIAAELPILRDKGLLTSGLLAALPNSSDDLDDRYDRICRLVIEAFQTQELVPARGGGFAKADDLVWSPSYFTQVLDEADLASLQNLSPRNERGSSPTKWLTSTSSMPAKAKRFLDSIDIDRFDEEAVSSLLSLADSALAESWFQSHTADKLGKVYAWLGRVEQEWGLPRNHPWRTIRFVRVRGSEKYLTAQQAYIPSKPSEKFASCVSGDVLAAPDTEKRMLQVKFLRAAGVRHWDQNVRIKQWLALYAKGSMSFDDRQHLTHIKTFVRVWREVPDLIATLRRTKFLAGQTQEGNRRQWCAPPSLYAAAPLGEAGLAETIEGVGCNAFQNSYGTNRRIRLWEGYAHDDGFDLSEFREFLAAVGVVVGPTVQRASIRRNSGFRSAWMQGRATDKGKNEDWTIAPWSEIEGFAKYLTDDYLAAVWRWVLDNGLKHAAASYQHNGSSDLHQIDSQLVAQLRDTPWIPTVTGKRVKPCDVNPDELPSGWEFREHNRMLDKIDFAANARSRLQEVEGRKQRLQELGLSDENYELYKELENQNPEVLTEMLQRIKSGGVLASAGKSPTFISPDGGDEEEAKKLDKKGMKWIVPIEGKEGRTVHSIDQNNSKWDFITTDAEGNRRYVELKTTKLDLAKRGSVTMSKGQFTAAMEKGSAYWLYILRIIDDEQGQLWRIRDPWGLVSNRGVKFSGGAISDVDPEDVTRLT